MKAFRTLLLTVPVVLTLLLASTSSAAGRAHRRVCDAASGPNAACDALVVTDTSGKPLATTSPSGYGPSQFHSAYGLPATASNLQTIAIVDAYDDPTITSDLATYSSTYHLSGLPTCTSPTQAAACFIKVNQRGKAGSYPLRSPGWSLEIALDVETAHQICQNCKIILVEASSASFSNLGAAEDTAASLGANAISNSYGGSEFSTETSNDSHYNHSGIAITVSSGDSGYGVEYPAASRFVTAVGGTSLNVDSNGNRTTETVWSGSGSGCSAFESKPSWQTDSGCARRTVADVSADADPATGAAVYDTTRYQGQAGWFQVGGTSLASPLIAGVYALAANATSSTYPASIPYAHTSSLFDVLSGSNGSCSGSYLCTAGLHYDGPSGLGSPTGIGAF